MRVLELPLGVGWSAEGLAALHATFGLECAKSAFVFSSGHSVRRWGMALAALLGCLAVTSLAQSPGLHPGDRDPRFFPVAPTIQERISAVCVQPDQKVLVAKYVAGGPRTQIRLIRLLPDGALDPAFAPSRVTATLEGGAGISALALQGDQILVAGDFSSMNSANVRGVARLNADGSFDSIFDAQHAPTVPFGIPAITDLAVTRDGEILVLGNFYQLGNQPAAAVARLRPDGVFDASFTSPIRVDGTTRMYRLLHEPAGTLLALGDFDVSVTTVPRSGLVRLDVAGNYLPEFLPDIPNPNVPISAGVQADGGIVLSSYAPSRESLVRLLPNGQRDPSFTIGFGPETSVQNVSIPPTGGILAAGNFSTWNREPRASLVRLLPDGRLDPQFRSPGFRIESLGQVTFQGTDRALLPGVFRDTNGVYLPPIVAIYLGAPPRSAPAILAGPITGPLEAGENLFLSAQVEGYPRSAQWWHDGVPIPGATEESFSLYQVGPQDAGWYSLQVSNELGSVTTEPVRLDVGPSAPDANLISNPSFERLVARPDRTTFIPFPAVGWTGDFYSTLRSYPFDIPVNDEGTQNVRHGTNYAKVGAYRAMFGPTPSYAFRSELATKLGASTVPGHEYEFIGWISRAESSLPNKLGLEVTLIGPAGRRLVLGTVWTTDSTAWVRGRLTAVVSTDYNELRVAATVPIEGPEGVANVYLDHLALRDLGPARAELASIAPQTVSPWTFMVLTNALTTAEDPRAFDSASLRYSLGHGNPPRVVLNPLDGILRWLPEPAAAGKDHTLTVIAAFAESTLPPATNRIQVHVQEGLAVGLGPATVRAGDAASMTITATFLAPTDQSMSEVSFEVAAPVATVGAPRIVSPPPLVTGSQVSATDTGRYRVRLQVSPGEFKPGTLELGQLEWSTTATVPSAIYPVQPDGIDGLKVGGGDVAAPLANPGRLAVVNREPLLELIGGQGRGELHLYGLPGRKYRLESAVNFSAAGPWTLLREVTVTAFPEVITAINLVSPRAFFRVKEIAE